MKTIKYSLNYSSWHHLPDQVKAFFKQFFDQDDAKTRQFFENYFFKMNIIHELSHALRHHHQVTSDMYDEEMIVNQLAAAFFLKADALYLNKLEQDITHCLSMLRDPTPKDQTARQYFNENYDTIGMIADIYGYYQFSFVLDAIRNVKDLTASLREHVNPKATPNDAYMNIKIDISSPKNIDDTYQKIVLAHGLSYPKVTIKNIHTPSIQVLSWA